MDMPPILKLLTLEETAQLLRKSPSQLRWMRHRNDGPQSGKLGGRVMYRESDVLAWINQAFEDSGAA